MKILYVDLLYDYGVKSRGFNYIGQLGFKASFERLGHVVEAFYYDDYLRRTDELQIELIRVADVVRPDLIFFCLFQDQFSVKTLQDLSSRYVTMNWFGDDQWRFDAFTKYYASSFTWCITTDKFSIPRYKQLGQNNIIHSQWAAIDDSTRFDITPPNYEYDVSFVGGYHPYRAWFLSRLSKSGLNVRVFGNGWPTGPLSNEEMTALFKKTKINLNISNSASFDVRYLLSSTKSLMSALRASKSSPQVKARNFEIPYYGGFQLSDYVPHLEEYFSIGTEVVCYSSPDEAIAWINYYLRNDVEREAIRLRGTQKARCYHAYSNRIEKIFEILA
ncbi:glycosyltransferase [Pseudomonas sp. ENNP23]|uniref:CgeB family protein n=1 Tax=Pseudomonas sp. ENNP23 TaxID=1535636 RepID=UPI00084ABDF6|nr:glycosyltransferase [Pseudomonas sp. ENNP23]OEC59562.1 hypothetical protein A9G05_10600 [Pseudomonas sp. ENNP23]